MNKKKRMTKKEFIQYLIKTEEKGLEKRAMLHDILSTILKSDHLADKEIREVLGIIHATLCWSIGYNNEMLKDIMQPTLEWWLNDKMNFDKNIKVYTKEVIREIVELPEQEIN